MSYIEPLTPEKALAILKGQKILCSITATGKISALGREFGADERGDFYIETIAEICVLHGIRQGRREKGKEIMNAIAGL